MKKHKATTSTDKNISDILSKRLDPTLYHFPRATNPNIRFGLHKLVGMETERNIGYCPSCNVNLCIACYSGFHSVTDFVKDKNTIYFKLKT